MLLQLDTLGANTDTTGTKRLVHFSQWFTDNFSLNPKLTKEVCTQILSDIVKSKKPITIQLVTQELKKHNINYPKSSYFHSYDVIFIMITLDGNLPLNMTISQDTINNIHNMFLAILKPHEKYCKINNAYCFFPYTYVAYKFFQLLHLDKLIQFYNLPAQHGAKLENCNNKWGFICNELNWTIM